MVLGLPPTLSIIYTNIIPYLFIFVKAFNLSFPSAVAFVLACLNLLLILILYHNYFYMSSTFFIGVRLPLGLAQCDVYLILILILYTFYIWKSSDKTCRFRLLPLSSVCSRRIARLSFFLFRLPFRVKGFILPLLHHLLTNNYSKSHHRSRHLLHRPLHHRHCQ